jgi:hypothetical protein
MCVHRLFVLHKQHGRKAIMGFKTLSFDSALGNLDDFRFYEGWEGFQDLLRAVLSSYELRFPEGISYKVRLTFRCS